MRLTVCLCVWVDLPESLIVKLLMNILICYGVLESGSNVLSKLMSLRLVHRLYIQRDKPRVF